MKTFARLGMLLLAMSMFVGCNSTEQAPSASGDGPEINGSTVRDDMSPELQTVAHSKEQQLNYGARTVDTNLRQIWTDWDRFWLLDQPLRLSPYPIP